MMHQLNDRNTEIEAKIKGYGSLRPGWHYGEGVTPPDSNIQTALKLHDTFLDEGFTRTNAFPGVDGEVRVTAYHNQYYLELTVEVDGSITFVYESGDEEIAYEENLSPTQANAKIKYRGRKWTLSDLSISDGSIMNVGASHQWLLGHQVEKEAVEYPSLMESAPDISAESSADISQDSTQDMKPSSQQSSGNFFQQIYQMTAS